MTYQIKKFVWQAHRLFRQNWIWYKCDECGHFKVGERVKVHALYGDVWCVRCYAAFLGIYE